MKPIPGTDANNTGLAKPGDVIDAVCALRDNRGKLWNLVINRTGTTGHQSANTVGFVWYNALEVPQILPVCYGSVELELETHRTTLRSDLVQADMKPIPGTDADNTGLARRDPLDAICYLRDNNNVRWDLVLNREGTAGQQYADTVGFIMYILTWDVYELPEC